LALGCLLLLGCGETSRNGVPANEDGAGAAAGGTAGHSPATGGQTAAGGSVDDVKVGSCVFEDPNVAQLVRYQVLQADGRDGPVDGSVGIEAVTQLDVSQQVGALGGIECLENLEELRLAVYGGDARPVDLAALAGLSRLRKLWLYGPFVLDGMFGKLSLEFLSLTGLELHDLTEVAKEPKIQELWLEDVSLTNLNGIEALGDLSKLRVENAALSSLAPLAKTSALQEIQLQELPTLWSLTGLEPHTGLRQLTTTDVPIQSLLPLAHADLLQAINVQASKVDSLEGLENKPLLSSVSVTRGNVQDVVPLSGLPALSYLSLSENHVSDLGPLASCLALSTIDVHGNAILSLASLAPLESLRTLIVGNNSLRAIDVELPASLITLALDGNAITSIEPLAQLGLSSLDISRNPLQGLAPVFDLPELRNLMADEVGATSLEAFPLTTLRSLSVRNNHIESAAPLSGLAELSVDLSDNDIVSLPPDFVGPAAQCGGLMLFGNPLDAAARARLTWLCANDSAEYYWDGGMCSKCPIL
jgi:internalin A